MQQTEKEKIKKNKKDQFNTLSMLPISEIRDNILILKDWWLRAIVKVWGLNLDLKNPEEQQITIQQYKKFLNSLNFPIQILIRSTYLDITDYVHYIKDKVSQIDNEVLKWYGQQYQSFLEKINLTQWLAYTKEFYIIVPYYELNDAQNIAKPWWRKFLDTLTAGKDSPEQIAQRYRSFIKNKKHLQTRVNLVIEWLKSINIMAEQLEIEDILALLFKVYNPTAAKGQEKFFG